MIVAGINLPIAEAIIILQLGIALFLLWKIAKK
jgi:hypothetical protein